MGERKLELQEQTAIIACLTVFDEFLCNVKSSSNVQVAQAANMAHHKMKPAILILEKTLQALDKEKHS